MEARKCDICGGFFLPYIASNKNGGKRDSYNEIIVKEKRMGFKNASRYQKGKSGHPAVGPVWDLLLCEN